MIAYVSSDPAVLALWEAEDSQNERWRQAAREVQAEMGDRAVVYHSGFGDDRAFGLRETDHKASPPAGWRWNKSDRFSGVIVPRKTKDADAEAARAVMAKVTAQTPHLISRLRKEYGAPDLIIADGRWWSPGVTVIAGRVWVTYGCQPEYLGRLGGDKPWDGGHAFTRQPLSVYYAAVEDAERVRA